jgi:hypothetical protein
VGIVFGFDLSAASDLLEAAALCNARKLCLGCLSSGLAEFGDATFYVNFYRELRSALADAAVLPSVPSRVTLLLSSTQKNRESWLIG